MNLFREAFEDFSFKNSNDEEDNNIFKLIIKEYLNESLANQDKLKNVDYIDLKNYYKIKNFDVYNYKRYETYKTDKKCCHKTCQSGKSGMKSFLF